MELMAKATGGTSLISILIEIIVSVLYIIAMWRIFEKAGSAGYKSIIPVYNCIEFMRIIGINPIFIVAFFIPFANFILIVAICRRLAKCFGKGTGFAIGLFLLYPIFTIILGFGNSAYQDY